MNNFITTERKRSCKLRVFIHKEDVGAIFEVMCGKLMELECMILEIIPINGSANSIVN